MAGRFRFNAPQFNRSQLLESPREVIWAGELGLLPRIPGPKGSIALGRCPIWGRGGLGWAKQIGSETLNFKKNLLPGITARPRSIFEGN